VERIVALLSSRQPLCPSGSSAWVEQVSCALDWVVAERLTLCSSTGTPTWDLITAAASHRSIPMQLLIPSTIAGLAACESEIRRQFDLERSRTTVSIVAGPRPRPSAASRMTLRDRTIIQTAALLLPISISPKGNMARLLAKAEVEGKTVRRDFEIPYSARTESIAYRLSPDRLNPDLNAIDGQYLIHWTRAPHGRWPDEREIDYYRAIFDSTTYPRSALATLSHIVATGWIRASARHMPSNLPCVSFSASAPAMLLPLMRWRARYRQMSFEPYGIGINKDVARAAGIEPVSYTPHRTPSSDDRKPWLRQTSGEITDWRQEKEHRLRGDLSLPQFSPRDLILFCRTNDEAEQLRQSFGLTTIPFYR